MMRFSFILLLGIFIFSSCRDEITVMENTPDLFNSWKWEISTGGIAGISNTPESSGDQIIIEFSPDYIYREFVNRQLVFESKFRIIQAESIYQTQPAWMIRYDNRSVSQSYVIRDNNSLTLYDEVYDGFVHEYKRITH